MMTPVNRNVSTRQVAESEGILRWIFLRGTKALTCEVRVCGKQPYDVCVVPHWDVSSSVIETFQRPAGALQRHAELASYLRQAGWSLIRGGAGQTTRVVDYGRES